MIHSGRRRLQRVRVSHLVAALLLAVVGVLVVQIGAPPKAHATFTTTDAAGFVVTFTSADTLTLTCPTGGAGGLSVNGGAQSVTACNAITSLTITGDANANVINLNAASFSDANLTQAALTITTNLGTGNDTVNYGTDFVGGAVNLNGQGGDDTITVTSTGAAVTVNGGTENDTVTVTQSGVVTGLTVTNTAGEGTDILNVTGNGTIAINGTTVDSTTGGDVTYVGTTTTTETLNVTGGNADAALNVTTTSAATMTNVTGGTGIDTVTVTTTAAPLTVNAGAGADPITITNTGAAATVNGDAGDDAIVVTATGAAATVNGGADNDTFTVAQNTINAAGLTVTGGAGATDAATVTGANTAQTVALNATTLDRATGGDITYDNTLETLTITGSTDVDTTTVTTTGAATTIFNLGNGADDTTVTNTAGALTVNGDAAGDIFTVNDTGAAATVDGGAGGDTFTVAHAALTGTLTVIGGADVGDALTSNTTAAGAETVTLSATVLTRTTGSNIAYNNTLETLVVNGGTGADTVTVTATEQLTTTTINGNNGDEAFTITLGAVGAAGLTVNGGNPLASDTVTINGTVGNDTITVAPTTVALTGGGTVTYGTVESLTVAGGGGTDTCNTTNTTPATATTVCGTVYPGIVGVAPATGSQFGGTTVVITGTNFTNATGVTFGGNPVTSFVINSATQITAVSPPGEVGNRDVVVNSSTGTPNFGSAGDNFFYEVGQAQPPPTTVTPTPEEPAPDTDVPAGVDLGTAVVEQTLDLATDATMDASGNLVVTAASADGDVSVTVPVDALPAGTTSIDVSVQPVADTAALLDATTPPTGSVIVAGQAFDIDIIDNTGAELTEFAQPLTLSFKVDPATTDLANLAVFFYDSAAGVWTQVDPANVTVTPDGIVTFTVDHFTLFALFEVPGEEAVVEEPPVEEPPVEEPAAIPSAFQDLSSRGRFRQWTDAETTVRNAIAGLEEEIKIVWLWNPDTLFWASYAPDIPAAAQANFILKPGDVLWVVGR